jgi:hypothetical protein
VEAPSLELFGMIGLEGILSPTEGPEYTLRDNLYVIGALQSIVPESDSQWMSTMQLNFAHQAWEQVEKAYGSKAELDMQIKLFEFESAHQQPSVSIHDYQTGTASL